MYIIRIAEWNANGLMKHIQELIVFLKNEKIDICLISETHFTKETCAKIKGYQIHHTIHPFNKASGGSAVIIKENILHTNLKLNILSFKIQTREQELHKFFRTRDNNFIIGGDFSAKHTYWSSSLTTAKGKSLYEAGMEMKCQFHSTGKPTYGPADTNKTLDVIDFFVVKGVSANYIHVEESYDLASDHSNTLGYRS